MENNGIVKKKTLGRRKIDMKKIEKLSSLQVTYCKRRTGLFHKAAELCISTGAEVGIIVQSVSGHKTFTFGHQNIDSVINKYLYRVSTPVNFQFSCDVLNQMQRYAAVNEKLEAEKKKNKDIIRVDEKKNNGDFWWNRPSADLALEELEQHLGALEELKKNVLIRADELKTLEFSSASVSASDLISFDTHQFDDFFMDSVDIDECLNMIYT